MLFKELTQIAEFYGAKLIKGRVFGYDLYTGTITISMENKKNVTISGFFHELAHHCNTIDRKFPLYHSKKFDTLKLNRKLVYYAFRAECYTDKIGKQLIKLWYPNIKYEFGYGNRESLYWLYGYYNV